MGAHSRMTSDQKPRINREYTILCGVRVTEFGDRLTHFVGDINKWLFNPAIVYPSCLIKVINKHYHFTKYPLFYVMHCVACCYSSSFI